MTRINCVPPVCLTKQHLMAEYREITRPFGKMRKRIESGNLDFVVPDKYTLGTGHETFFFNKLKYLHDRYGEIYNALRYYHDVNVDSNAFYEIHEEQLTLSNTEFWNYWTPTPEDMYVNMARLAHRHFKDRIDDFK